MNSPCLRVLLFVCEDNDNYDDVNGNDGSRCGVRTNADYIQENKMSNCRRMKNENEMNTWENVRTFVHESLSFAFERNTMDRNYINMYEKHDVELV